MKKLLLQSKAIMIALILFLPFCSLAQTHKKVKIKRGAHCKTAHCKTRAKHGQATTGQVSVAKPFHPKQVTAPDRTKISPNDAPNQSQIDSIKRVKAKQKFGK